jgi:predicted HAD superfamily phosphohydrolase
MTALKYVKSIIEKYSGTEEEAVSLIIENHYKRIIDPKKWKSTWERNYTAIDYVKNHVNITESDIDYIVDEKSAVQFLIDIHIEEYKKLRKFIKFLVSLNLNECSKLLSINNF